MHLIFAPHSLTTSLFVFDLSSIRKAQKVKAKPVSVSVVVVLLMLMLVSGVVHDRQNLRQLAVDSASSSCRQWVTAKPSRSGA